MYPQCSRAHASSQIVMISVLTAFAAKRPSRRVGAPGTSQLAACPSLVALNVLWLGRLLIMIYINSWMFRMSHRCVPKLWLVALRTHAQHSYPIPPEAGIRIIQASPSAVAANPAATLRRSRSDASVIREALLLRSISSFTPHSLHVLYATVSLHRSAMVP